MSVYTITTLPTQNAPDPDDICDFLNDTVVGGDFEVTGCGTVQSIDSFKWFEFADDMTYLSEDYPRVVFVLDIINERTGPVAERVYFKDGLAQFTDASITLEDFDEAMLEVV